MEKDKWQHSYSYTSNDYYSSDSSCDYNSNDNDNSRHNRVGSERAHCMCQQLRDDGESDGLG